MIIRGSAWFFDAKANHNGSGVGDAVDLEPASRRCGGRAGPDSPRYTDIAQGTATQCVWSIAEFRGIGGHDADGVQEHLGEQIHVEAGFGVGRGRGKGPMLHIKAGMPGRVVEGFTKGEFDDFGRNVLDAVRPGVLTLPIAAVAT
jgi:hypothetical protein